MLSLVELHFNNFQVHICMPSMTPCNIEKNLNLCRVGISFASFVKEELGQRCDNFGHLRLQKISSFLNFKPPGRSIKT